MTKVKRYAAGTKVIRTADGTYMPIADDDPRAHDAVGELLNTMEVIEGDGWVRFNFPGYFPVDLPSE